jgi:hypothetical protein
MVGAIILRDNEAVRLAGRVIDELFALALECAAEDDELQDQIRQWSAIGGVSLELLEPGLRRRTIAALWCACQRARERFVEAIDDVEAFKGYERVALGANDVIDLLLGADDWD